jgi:hypothetical protein
MKKYTVYEIEKLTNGKLTKYKLNQAILKGDLLAENVKGEKKGKGVPKYYIIENDLEDYLKKLEAQKKKRIEIPGEEKAIETSTEIKEMVQELISQKDQIIQSQTDQLNTLKERIHLLETKQSSIAPANNNDDTNKAEERRELIMELANLSVFSVKKRNEALKKLSRLA